MIEVIYSGETRKPKTQAEETLAALKNIRQIGNIVGNTKIYVEDCVMNFLNRQMQKSDPGIVALLGKESKMDGSTYLFVNGALLPEGIFVKGESLEFAPQAFPRLYEDAESYFPEAALLGWYLPAYDMIGKYGATLGQNCRLFLLEDPTESEEIFYLWEQSRLIKQSGYYIYYQRNEEMKNYMQNCKEKTEEDKIVRKTWTVENRTKDRPKEKNLEKEEDFVDDYVENEIADSFLKMPSSKLTTFLYGASTVLAIVVLVIGITLINNYEKMYEMQEAIEAIATSLSGDGDKQEAGQTTDGQQPKGEQGQESAGTGDTPINTDTPKPAATENAGQSENAAPQSAGRPADTVPAEGSATAQMYTIQQGDTLAGICRKIYQNTDKIDEILQLNQGLDANELIVGEKIILP